MIRRRAKLPPRWAFSILMAGGFVECGIHLGVIRAEGISTGRVICAIGFGTLGLLMLWGVLGRR